MKRIATLVAIIFCTTMTFSQRDITKKTGNFSEIKVFDLITVNLIKSDETRVVVRGENPESVQIVEDGNILKVRMILEESFDGNKTFVDVYYKSLQVLDANEGSLIVSNETINTSNLEVRSQEGGKIDVVVNATRLDIKAVSGGIVNLSGKADAQNISINSGGIYEGKELYTKITTVSVTAGGSADVYSTELCDAKVTAGGNVTIYGNPADIKRKRFAGGKIKVKN